MSLSGKVLIVCSLVASLLFVYLAARTVDTHHQWGALATARQNDIDQFTKDLETLEKQKREHQDQIHRALIGWERVWDNVNVVNVDPDEGIVTLSGDAQQLAGLEPQRIVAAAQGQAPEPRLVHAFALEGSPPTYLGEFLVESFEVNEAANTSTARLQPAVRVDTDRLQQAAQVPWRLRALIPDGLKAKLRDHATDLSLALDQAQRRASTADMWEETVARAEEQRSLREEAVAQLEQQRADTEVARDEALATNTRLKEELNRATMERDAFLTENKRLAEEIGRLESILVNQSDQPARTASVTLP